MERQQASGSQTAQEVSVKVRSIAARRVQFTDAREEYEPCSDVHPEMKNCPGSQVISDLARMICLRSSR